MDVRLVWRVVGVPSWAGFTSGVPGSAVGMRRRFTDTDTSLGLVSDVVREAWEQARTREIRRLLQHYLDHIDGCRAALREKTTTREEAR